MNSTSRRSLLVSRGWIQAAGIVLLCDFFIMGVLTYYTYNDEPPIPQAVKDSSGNVLFTGVDILAGQGIFLRNGLMEYGSIFGHGAYLGPDFTAEYLHRAALFSIDYFRMENRSIEYGMRRFHRGLSLTLVFLAILILSVEMFRAHDEFARIAVATALTLLCIIEFLAGKRLLDRHV